MPALEVLVARLTRVGLLSVSAERSRLPLLLRGGFGWHGWASASGRAVGWAPTSHPSIATGQELAPGPPALMEGAGGWRAPWSLLAGLCLLFASHLHLGPGWPRGSGHLAWEPGQWQLWGLLGCRELPVPPLAPAWCWVLPSLMSACWAPLALMSAR